MSNTTSPYFAWAYNPPDPDHTDLADLRPLGGEEPDRTTHDYNNPSLCYSGSPRDEGWERPVRCEDY